MEISLIKRHRAGYISFLLVLATGAVLTALMFAAYRRALGSQMIESKVQLRADYGEKEEAILRSIVALTPNQAIRAMKTGSSINGGTNAPLGWPGIFAAALTAANAQNSISPGMMNSLGITNIKSANTGDGALGNPGSIFAAIPTTPVEPGMISAGINRSLIGMYPPPLTSNDPTTNGRDVGYPIISDSKQYGALAQSGLNSATLNGSGGNTYGLPIGTYSKFNRLKYPATSFGYARPGDAFVAKRNWWAFSMNVGNHDGGLTGVVRPSRNFVLSIYEIPSQLPISAASSMLLGQYAGGGAWQNTTIDGNISLGNANITGGTALTSLSLRRGLAKSAASSIGGVVSATPFDTGTAAVTGTPAVVGTREAYQLAADKLSGVSLANQTTMGSFFPVSMASESGRAAFIPISRGRDFFDRFDTEGGRNDLIEAAGARNHFGENSLSGTSWNNYSIGAQQCAMRLDIVGGAVLGQPTTVRFSYFLVNGDRQSDIISLEQLGILPNLPPGYERVCNEGETIVLPGIADVAYGAPGGFSFNTGVGGPVTFNNSTFGDPISGVPKGGYVRRSLLNGVPTITKKAFEQTGNPVDRQFCISIFPERIQAFLASLPGAAGTGINNSLAVNVDYSNTGFGTTLRKPNIPCRPTPDPLDPVRDYGVVLKECNDMTTFPKGFSLVTNLRIFIGDNWNGTYNPVIPLGYIPTVTLDNPNGWFLPPCSVFAPEKRWGADPTIPGVPLPNVTHQGQIGSLAKVDQIVNTDVIPVIRPLDAIRLGGVPALPGAITSSLTQIRHPAELPPISMMNWLVLLEEVR